MIAWVGTDNCSSLMRTRSGFQTLQKNDITSVFVMSCICHSLALYASHAVSLLPSYMEVFLKDITFNFPEVASVREVLW